VLRPVTVGAAPAGVSVNLSAAVTPVIPSGVWTRMSTVVAAASGVGQVGTNAVIEPLSLIVKEAAATVAKKTAVASERWLP
jgi:hypothetical protein